MVNFSMTCEASLTVALTAAQSFAVLEVTHLCLITHQLSTARCRFGEKTVVKMILQETF